jgi:pimeloyl-ACP methyl ester carboxylesterase
VLYGDLVACHQFDIVDRLGELAIPALVICGQQDQMTPPERSVYLHEHIADSELQFLDPGGHNVMVEQPDKVADFVARFLDTLTAPPS